jgi:hypothetical protein
MSQERFDDLIRGWGRLTGAADVEDLVRHNRVRVGETLIELVYHEDEAPRVLFVAYFDKLPGDDAGKLAMALLHANFTQQVLGLSLCWSVNPRTAQVIAHDHAPLDALAPAVLQQRLQDFAELAQSFRQ